MKSFALSEPVANRRKAVTQRPCRVDELHVALIYDSWSSELRERTSDVVGERNVICSEWRIADLHDAKIFSEGIRALAKADVIAVGILRPGQVPNSLYPWVNLWLQLRNGAPGVLIALVDVADLAANSTESDNILDYLRAVASQGKLNLQVQELCQSIEASTLAREDLELAAAV